METTVEAVEGALNVEVPDALEGAAGSGVEQLGGGLLTLEFHVVSTLVLLCEFGFVALFLIMNYFEIVNEVHPDP